MFLGGKPLGYGSLRSDMRELAMTFCAFKLSVRLINASTAFSGRT